MRDEKFYDRVKDIIIYKTIDGEFLTLDDFTDKHGEKVFYVADEKKQAQHVNIFKRNNLSAVVLPTIIDRHFIQFIEFKNQKVKFSRIDSDISDAIKTSDKGDSAQTKWLEEVFKAIGNNDKMQVKFESIKASEIPAMILVSEQSRRMREFGMQFGIKDEDSHFDDEKTLIVNLENDLVKALLELKERDDKKQDVKDLCEVVYSLALIGHDRLTPDNMMRFLQKSSSILARIVKH